MLLGDIIAGFEDEALAYEALVSLDDLVLLNRVETAAEAEGLTVGEYATQAVAQFSATATDEDWVSLIGVIGRTDDPGHACLKRMVEFALKPKVESHVCGHGHHHHAPG